MKKKVILAYSGGLDTSVILKWLQEKGYEVIAYVGDVGHTIDFRDSSYSSGDGISVMNSNSLEDFQFNAVLLYYDMFEKTSTPDVRRVSTNLYGILFLDQVTPISGNGAKGYIQRYPKKN